MITLDTTFQAENETLNAYYARPNGDGPFPGLLVIHEAFGLNDNIKDITRRFADQGYAAFAVDLFSNASRVMCMFRLFAGMQFNSLEHRGIKQLRAALDFLASQKEVDGKHLGAVGYCLGGGLAIALACTDNRLKAIAPYYGMNPRPLDAVKRACPVVGSYPKEDFTASAGQALEMELDKNGVAHDIKIYDGAKHSFFSDTGRNYNADAAQDSWERVLAFFKEHVNA